jgi:calcium-dependent protein kinase
MHGKVGTLVTMSPEVLRGDYTAKADIWSVGVIAYILLSGKYPFNGNTEKEIASGIVEGKYQMDSKEWTYVSQPAKDFVSSLLTYDPDKRPTASQALASPWLRKTFSLKDRRPPNEVMNSVKNALVQSAKASNFKKLVAMLIAHKRSNEAIKELREAFDAIDTNNHGTITYWEFRSALKDCNFSDEELKSMFRGIDVNESGVINYTEFLAMTLESRGRIEEDEIMQAFDRIDADRSGFISKENLCDILDAKCSAENCDAMVQEILDELDSDRDGQISYEEFLEMFREKHREELDKECCQLEEALPKTKYGCS